MKQARQFRESRSGRWGLALLPILAVAASLAWGPGPAGAAGQVGIVSHASGSAVTTATGTSTRPTVSADGAYVVFLSTATDLVAGQVDTNNVNDVFLHNTATGAVTLVSHSAAGATTTGNGVNTTPAISADGLFVAFTSAATDLVAGGTDANAGTDVFLFSRATGAVTLVSHTAAQATTAAGAASSLPALSANGSYVAFISAATDLVAGLTDPAALNDVFLYAVATGAVTLVSHTPASPTVVGNLTSTQPSISADGAFVAFQSFATDIVTGQIDANNDVDVFLYARDTGVISLVSHIPASAVTTANSASFTAFVSGNGASVAFSSSATNLVTGQTDTNYHLRPLPVLPGNDRRRPRVAHRRQRHHHARRRQLPGMRSAPTEPSSCSAPRANNLVAGQTDAASGTSDVFLYSQATTALELVSHVPASPTTTGNGRSMNAAFSADGSSVAFRSLATDLVAGQTEGNATDDVFRFDRASGAVTLVSHTSASETTTGSAISQAPSISANGAVVAFESAATNLVAGQSDANGVTDVFVSVGQDVGGEELPPPADFDGNGSTDISVFRASAGAWLIRDQATVFLGATGDIPVPCDFSGDGETDAAVFRPAVGGWYVDGQDPVFHGLSGDVPVPADYDGDGDCEIAVFRPAVGGWYILGQDPVFFGLGGDIPVPTDYDGNGSADIAIFRPSVGGWYRVGGRHDVLRAER